MNTKLEPFVKWAGGKRQLLGKIEECIPNTFNRYFEPFIGGGALLLSLQPQYAVINDTNMQLINIYKQLKNDSEPVILAVNKLDEGTCDKAKYLNVREEYNRKIASNELDAECAALMIWLNKHCFNGLYRVNSKGLFNVPYNNKVDGPSIDPNNLRDIGTYLRDNNVEILEGGFAEACATAESGDFVYFDSPYVPVSDTARFTDYTKDGFSLEDHERLAELFRKLDSLGVKVLLSNNDVPLVHELYAGYSIQQVDVRRGINSVASKRKGKEVLVSNY